jgi:hypothetical protein
MQRKAKEFETCSESLGGFPVTSAKKNLEEYCGQREESVSTDIQNS